MPEANFRSSFRSPPPWPHFPGPHAKAALGCIVREDARPRSAAQHAVAASRWQPRRACVRPRRRDRFIPSAKRETVQQLGLLTRPAL
eukprot:353364-Chlamydomonas_euryale.AAC.6